MAMVVVEVAGEDDGCELESAIEGRRMLVIYISLHKKQAVQLRRP